MKHVKLQFVTLTIYIIETLKYSVYASPIPAVANKEPRQVNFGRRPDGTIVASFSAANAFDAPGFDDSFAMSQTFEIGPKGMSSSGSSAFSSDVLGNKMSFANSQAQNSRNDVFGGGFSAANAAANSFSNPLFSGANSQANAFGSNFNGLGGFGR